MFPQKKHPVQACNPSNVHIRRGKVDWFTCIFTRASIKIVLIPQINPLLEFQDPTSFPGFFELIFPPKKKTNFENPNSWWLTHKKVCPPNHRRPGKNRSPACNFNNLKKRCSSTAITQPKAPEAEASAAPCFVKDVSSW